jgi:hypothetical protein
MKRFWITGLFLCSQAGIGLADDVSEQSIVDAINADILAAQTEEATMEERKLMDEKAREAGCLLKGMLVADAVTRRQADETVDDALAAIEADPTYELLPQRELLGMLVRSSFQYFGNMTPERAKEFSIEQCMQT